MRPPAPRAAAPRHGLLLRALTLATILLPSPWLAPEAAAARAGKPPAAKLHAPRHPQLAPTRTRHHAMPHRQAAPAPEVPGIRRIVVSALDGAIRATGIDPALLAALAWQESRFDPLARNGRSSARGLMQFTEATWLESVRDHGPRHGLRYEAAVLSTDPASGRITTRQPRTRARILDLRDNPRYAAALAAERIGRARPGLEAALGRPAGPADLYLVHLLGPAGAQRFLAALATGPAGPAADFVAADSLALNREVFVARDGRRPLSLREVHGRVTRSIAGQREMHPPLFAALGTAPLVELAEAR
ncbi:MAG: transglycosylase SLT domain-containing protein [Paracraurococcus sp.]|jgi:hypothetical protein